MYNKAGSRLNGTPNRERKATLDISTARLCETRCSQGRLPGIAAIVIGVLGNEYVTLVLS